MPAPLANRVAAAKLLRVMRLMSVMADPIYYPNNVVLSDQVGKEITFEGFADAYTEPITRVEYSAFRR